ncbi:MAG: FAD-dependent oxidoreductase [Asgard group archaeon]|nr:FAD-dependent oxidoreductase [Asgard group archaeon]
MGYDVIIIGGGIIGVSVAYHLQEKDPKQSVLLIEQNKRIGLGNTAKSAALYRNIFSSETSRQLASSSISFYETIANKIALQPLGYFWMFSENDWKKMKKIFSLIDKKQYQIKTFSIEKTPLDLKINTSGSKMFKAIDYVLHGFQCGALSATKLARFYASEFQRNGGEIVFNTKITTLELSNKKHHYPPWRKLFLEKIIASDGRSFSAEKYIFATGAWMNELLLPVGIAPHVYPKKRQLFALKIKAKDELITSATTEIPILIFPTGGLYLKPVLPKDMLLIGLADDLGNPYKMAKEYPPSSSKKYFDHVIKPVLHHYFPDLRSYTLFSHWAGYYSYHWPDYNPVIEQKANIVWVSGTSGSGIMKADAIGRIVAAKIMQKKTVELFDGSLFSVRDLSLIHRKVVKEDFII